MALKMGIKVLLALFFIATFLNIAKHFIRFNDHPKGTTIFGLDASANKSSDSSSRRSQMGGFDWDALLVCTDNASDVIVTTIDDSTNVTIAELELCPDVPPGLGPVGTGEAMINLAAVQNTYAELKSGGVYKGRKCKARQNVAIIVPYRGLKKFINPFLYFLHPFLMKQQLEYQIFVVGYGDKSALLNRGHLFNVGVSEALKIRGWSCLVLHEADRLPQDMRNLYRCTWYPRQLVAALEGMHKYSTDSKAKGGAVAITPDQFMRINGFDNAYLERDAFYDNFSRRILRANYTLEKSDKSIGMYKIMKYTTPDNATTEAEYEPTYSLSSSFRSNGFSNLSYKLNEVEFLYFYTHVNVSVPTFIHKKTTTKSTTESRKFEPDVIDLVLQ